MATGRLLIMGYRPIDFEFEPGKTFRQLCLDAREDASHGLRRLYERAKWISWTGVYCNLETIDINTFRPDDGCVIAMTERTQGSGGGVDAFKREMVRRIQNDLANPFTTDEQRARYEARNDERVWEKFWNDNGGSPPCSYSLDSVKPMEAPC